MPHLSWEAAPRSSLLRTLARPCRNVGRSRRVRGLLPGQRQFADPLEEAYLRPMQTSCGLGCDREPSREKGSRRLMLSTSTSNRAQANYRVGCRTRQKERKQQPRQQRNSTWPPTSVVIVLRIGVAKARPALRLSRKRVKIRLPTCFCLADLGSVTVIRDSRSQSWQETTQIIVAARRDWQHSIPVCTENLNPTKAGPMPTHERLGTDDREDLQDRRKPSIQLDKEPAIVVRKPRPTLTLRRKTIN